MARKCTNCQVAGHYAKCCPQTKKEESPKEVEVHERKTLKEIGREILAKEKDKTIQEREADLLGTIPEKGKWIVQPKKKIVRGKILNIKKNGNILYMDRFGAYIETAQKIFINEKYCYVDLEPQMLDWSAGI